MPFISENYKTNYMLDKYDNKLVHFILHTPTVKSGRLALALLLLAVIIAGVESALVQAYTTGQEISPELLRSPAFIRLSALDLLLPLTVVLLSRRAFIVYLCGQTFLSIILMHYEIFFYNPLTLSTIYHSMSGAGALGMDIFAFARLDIIVPMSALGVLKIALVKFAMLEADQMPGIWKFRGVISVSCMAIICWGSMMIYGRTGLSLVWVDSRGHRTATERRLEKGTWEAVRNIGYLPTWIGEFLSGTYKDTELIYAESFCNNLDLEEVEHGNGMLTTAPNWYGLPLPPLGKHVILMQVESLDFAILDTKVNGHKALPFLDIMIKESVLLKAFAPHKVGSSNSDYEILNSRVASQNVLYYSYIENYPHSVIHKINNLGYKASVFHGLPGALFSLKKAYKAQGFAETYFKEELLKAGYAGSRYIMNHIMDEDLLSFAMEKLLEDQKSKAQFIITMSSHVPFMDVMPIFKKTKGTFARYVSSLRYFDQSFAAYYAQLPEGTVLIMWGDHGSDVQYPRSFPENSRHVPFILHVKGNSDWMKSIPPRKASPTLASLEEQWAKSGDKLQTVLAPEEGEFHPDLACRRIFTLCELSYYLKYIFLQPASSPLEKN